MVPPPPFPGVGRVLERGQTNTKGLSAFSRLLFCVIRTGRSTSTSEHLADGMFLSWYIFIYTLRPLHTRYFFLR